MMEGKTVFYLDLFRALQERKVRYLLVGGVAMNLHGVPRMTMDVDVLLALDEANLNAFIKVTQDLGLKPQLPVSLESLKDPKKRAEWVSEKNMIAFSLVGETPSIPAVDVLIRHPLDFDRAHASASVRDIGGTSINLASIDDMIRLKEFAGREQDISDIEMLREFRNEEQ